MIRRETLGQDAEPRWVLVRQMDHAELAAEIVPFVGLDAFPPELHDQVVQAVRHHDDGWQQWDNDPDVDSTGRPIAFDEMRPVEVLGIWRKSIASAASFGALPGYAVAGHFLTLLERFTSWNRQGEPAVPEAAEFRRQYTEASNDWRSAFSREHSVKDAGLLDAAVRYLRTLDWISLWLCNNWKEPVLRVQTGDHQPTIELRRDADMVAKTVEVNLVPWRPTEKAGTLAVEARSVPQAQYASRQALSAARSELVALKWCFQPPSE